MFIINIEESPLRNRRYRIFLINGNHIDIGFKDCNYYIDNANKKERNLFYKILDKEQKHLIMTCKPSQLLYETFILNGYSTDLIKNINFYNQEFFPLKNEIIKENI